MAQKHIEKVRDLFQRYDSNGNDSLDLNELALLLQEISSKITALPAVSNRWDACVHTLIAVHRLRK